LISSLLYDDLPTLISLRAHGYRLLVISPDAVEFETRLLKPSIALQQAARIARLERQSLLDKLRRSGARVMEWQVEQPFVQAAAYPLGYAAFWRTRPGTYRA
jgi:hypothetical protein